MIGGDDRTWLLFASVKSGKKGDHVASNFGGSIVDR